MVSSRGNRGEGGAGPPSFAFLVAGLSALLMAPTAQAGDAAAGRQKAAICVTCHGPDGISQAPDAPNLAGQPEIYVIAQLSAYRSGKRQHEVMQVVTRDLSDRDIEDLAAWYASIRITAEPP